MTTLEDSGLPERHYDVVCAFHVLEHLPDSRAFLGTLSRWARPGGHIVIEVPNFRSLTRRRSGAEWVHLRPLEHLIYHSSASLRRAFTEADLKPVTVRTPTWLSEPQTVDEALTDLAKPPLRPVLRLLAQEEERGGGRVLVPRGAGWTALRGIGSLYDLFRVGMVIFGVGRVRDESR